MSVDWNKLAYPRLCGLIARQPSRLSQAMHNAGFRELGLPFCYVAFDVLDTNRALQAVRTLGIRGFSLTIPHKEAAMKLVDELTEDAKRIGAINTVINTGEKLIGYNTDWLGITRALQEVNFPRGEAGASQRALIVGAGGAARAAVYALQQLGVAEVLISNRTSSRSDEIARDFGIQSLSYAKTEQLEELDLDLLINATPVGSHLAEENATFLSVAQVKFNPGPIVFDMVTKDTRLLKQARSRGGVVLAGSRMLLHQAVEQFRLFTEQEVDPEILNNALERELASA